MYSNGILVDELTNMITNQALTAIRDILKGVSANYPITHLAIGTGTTAVTGAETTLVTEVFRTPVSSQSDITFKEVGTTFVVLDTEAVTTWREIGIFANGTMTANSGFLISRILYTKVKTANEEITIARSDSFNK
jgi:hypothetical protein